MQVQHKQVMHDLSTNMVKYLIFVCVSDIPCICVLPVSVACTCTFICIRVACVNQALMCYTSAQERIKQVYGNTMVLIFMHLDSIKLIRMFCE